ncbi:MAG: ANTAR domain-containing protein [Pseudomonadota bacterium]
MQIPTVLIHASENDRGVLLQRTIGADQYRCLPVEAQLAGLARIIEDNAPDVLVFDLVGPDAGTLEDVFRIARAVPLPVVVFVENVQESSIQKAVDSGVAAYVVDGFSEHRILTTLRLAETRYRALSRLRAEADAAKDALAERKMIDRAKVRLMSVRGLSEHDAYREMRTTAMNSNERIADVARRLLETLP